MYNPRDFDRPHPEEDEEEPVEGTMGELSGAVGSMAGFVQQNKGKIILIAALLIAVVFAYDYFIGSVRSVGFEIVDTEGRSLDANIKIIGESGEEIARMNSSEKANLRDGTYLADASATGFRTVRSKPMTVSGEKPVRILLEIDRRLELEGSFPTEFVAGEKKEVTLTISNLEKEPVRTRLVLGEDAANAMELSHPEPLVVTPGRSIVKATLTVEKEPSAARTGKGRGVIRIEGLDNEKARVEGEYTLAEFKPSKLRIRIGNSGSRLNYGRVTAGETVEKNIRIANSNDTQIRVLEARIVVAKTGFSDARELEKWFSFSPMETLTIPAGSEASSTLTLATPSNHVFPHGKESEQVSGKLTFSNTFYSQDFEISLTIVKPKTGTSLSGISSSYTLRKEGEAYKTESGFLEIMNSGEVLLRDVDVRITCNPTQKNWLTFGGALEKSFATLEKGAEEKIAFTIQAPATETVGSSIECSIGVLYNEPSGLRQSMEEKVTIRIG